MVNSSQKGKRGEAELVKLCKEWWGSDDFMRSPESGALSTMLEGFGAPEDLVGRLAGDLLVPLDFPFCIESKLYEKINLYSIITNPDNNQIKQWWDQCHNDAQRAKKIPLLSFRENRKQRYVLMDSYDYEHIGGDVDKVGYLEAKFGNIVVRIMLWKDFIEEFPRERFE